MPNDPPPVNENQNANGDTETIRNIKPPNMITDPSQFQLYEKRLQRWSRLTSLSKQMQFDYILSIIPTSNPLLEKLEREVGDSNEAETKGVQIIIDNLKEWFGRAEDAFENYNLNSVMLVTRSGNAQDAVAAQHLNRYLYNDEKPSQSEINDDLDDKNKVLKINHNLDDGRS